MYGRRTSHLQFLQLVLLILLLQRNQKLLLLLYELLEVSNLGHKKTKTLPLKYYAEIHTD